MTTVGKKILMATTGALLVLFLVAHVAGNLKFFSGRAAFDGYAAWLHSMPALLWTQRVVLLVAVLLHMWAATSLAIRARRARGSSRGGYVARTMRWGGVIIALFVVYHLLDLTTRDANPVADHARAYDAVVASFGRWYIAAFYVLAVAVLGFHLRHGIWSAFQTMGWRFPRTIALLATLLICGGFLSVPLAVVFGVTDAVH